MSKPLTATRTTGSSTSGGAKALPWVLLVLAVGLFTWHALDVRFVQDDSYITYRYARNIARGLGPVFNPGEKVEGYTNFLWTMLIAGFAVAGLPWHVIIPLTQLLGLLCGVGVLLLAFLLFRRRGLGPPWLAAIPPLLLAANGAFAYWCVSGMETGLFSLLLAAAFLLYLDTNTPRGRIAASVLLGMAAVTRPEGTLFMLLLLLHFAVVTLSRDRGRAVSVANLGSLAALLLPFLALVTPHYLWRLSYYGYPFPNTFYAKTGFSFSYLKSGAEYLWSFLQAYALWGLLFLVPAAAAIAGRRVRLASPLFFGLLVLPVFAAYTVLVGGDVLRIFRFYVPVLALLYLVVTEALWLLPWSRIASAAVLVSLLPYTFIAPFSRSPDRGTRDFLRRQRKVLVTGLRAEILRNQLLENGLVEKMTATGRWLNAHLDPDEWFAGTTIGAVSFAADRKMVDMLGLTDATIAHHPEDILGPRVYWKERNYNTRHVLQRNPAYIYFSTGAKPSAAAERALFLRTRFRVGYYPALITASDRSGAFTEIIYRRKLGADSLPLETPGYDASFVDLFNLGINLTRSRATLDSAVLVLRRCIEIAPPDFAQAWEWLGQAYASQGREDLATGPLQTAVAIDDCSVNAHEILGSYAFNRRDYSSASDHFGRVVRHAPFYANGYVNLAKSLLMAGDPVAAESVLQEGIRTMPGINVLSYQLNQLRAASRPAARGRISGSPR